MILSNIDFVEENMDSGLVYVVYNEWIRDPVTGKMPYKIGITTGTVDDRYYGLGLKMPGEFICYFAYEFDGTYTKVEKTLQNTLNQLNVNGEWFNVNEGALEGIRNICELAGGKLVTEKIEDEIEMATQSESKDSTQFIFNGEKYKKNRLVLAVIKEHILNNNISFEDLQKTFDKKLQGGFGVVDEYSNGENIYKTTGYKRHFIDDPLDLNNGQKIVVCSQWGIGNIGRFINRAKELGYNIEAEK